MKSEQTKTDLKLVTVPGHYLYVLSECIDDFGLEPRVWLHGSGLEKIDKSIIDEAVPFNTFQYLALKAEKMAQNPAIGLAVGRRLSLLSHGALGYAALNSATVRDAVHLIEAFIDIRFPVILVQFQEFEHEFRVVLEEKVPLGQMLPLVMDGVLLTLKNALDQLLARGVQDKLCITFATPQHAGFPYQSVFDCELKFNAECSAILGPKSILDEAIPYANSLAFQEAESLCRNELERLKKEVSITGKVKKKLFEAPGQFASLEVVASYLNLTPRTLHRRLADEESSYKQILEEVKSSLAISYLSNSDMSIKEIAFFLGYDDLSNFRRAFKRWTGQTPSTYRDQPRG